MRFLGEKLWTVKEFRAKHDVEVRKIETKTNKALDELRVDLVRFLPEESLDALVRELMGQFDKLNQKKEILGEVLTLRIQDKK